MPLVFVADKEKLKKIKSDQKWLCPKIKTFLKGQK